MNMIVADGVSFQYEYPDEPPLKVLEHIDLTIEQGSFVALLGHNGCGKSTIAKHFNAMLLPTGGTVLVKEMNTSDEALKYEVRRTVGMVLQNPDNQLVSTIVEEDVAFGPENLGVPPEEIRRRVDDALRAVDMFDYRTHAPHKLSGGQKQRIAIAGIIAMEPECIVLDEPTAMLDPHGRREVLDTVRRLNKERGITIVLITHYMDEAVQADRVVVMDDGAILMDGAPREVFSRVDELRRVELDVPQPTELCHALRGRGLPLPEGVLTAAECAEAIALLPVSGAVPAAAPAAPAPALPAEPVLETEALTYVYAPGSPFEKTAMHDVSLTVNRGDFVGIIGHTGSGKSTLVQHLNGLLRPTSGRVLLEGRDIWEDPKKIRAVRFRVGMVFQYPEHQLFEDTCYKDIAFGPKNMGLSEEEIDKRVRQAAAFVGLREELLEKSPLRAVRRRKTPGRHRRRHGHGTRGAHPGRAHRRPGSQGPGHDPRADPRLSGAARHHRAAGLSQHGGYRPGGQTGAGYEPGRGGHVRPHRGGLLPGGGARSHRPVHPRRDPRVHAAEGQGPAGGR